MTIIYERHGERVIRLTQCWHCGADAYLKAGQSGDRHLCPFCKKQEKRANGTT